MSSSTIEAYKKATETAAEVQPAAEPKAARTPRAARVTGGAKLAKLRLTSRAKSPKKANGTATTKAPVQPKAKAQKNGGLPPRAKNDFSDDQKITMVKPPEAAWLKARYELLKDGITVGGALAVFTAQTPKLRRRRESLRRLIEGGYVSVK